MDNAFKSTYAMEFLVKTDTLALMDNVLLSIFVPMFNAIQAINAMKETVLLLTLAKI
jgi:hypothetical protein